MKAFVLAAGHGERMRPLTNTLPKPLIDINGKSLIEHQVLRLVAAGVQDIIVNTAYLGHMIEQALGDGHTLGAHIRYSREHEPLETAGALLHARELLGEEPFLLINADVWSDIDLAALANRARRGDILAAGAHLVLVPKPAFKREGDFSLQGGMLQTADLEAATYTFSGVSVMDPRLVNEYPSRRRVFALKEVLDWGVAHHRISAEVHWGYWLDVGTPDRLQALREHLRLR